MRLLALILVLLGFTPASASPNIIVILTDDQTEQMITGVSNAGRPFMPFLRSKMHLARRFDTAIFTQSLCCPSRTSLLTGMYPHNHGVTNNKGPDGGYQGFMSRRLDSKTWANELRYDYFTGMFGKFLNGYSDDSTPRVPDGWHRWYGFTQGAGNMFNWNANHNGRTVEHRGDTDATYSTNVLAELVATTIRQSPRPFALLFAPPAPHLPAVPANEFRNYFLSEPLAPQRKWSFNEQDVTDKPTAVFSTPKFTATQIASLQTQWRRMLESGLSIDKAVKTIWETLEATGQLDNTYIVYASDNGFLWGEHRISNKLVPYRESIQSTMLIWGPGVVPGIDHHIVTNADLMPTFMQIAGKPIPEWVDGRSLLPLLRGQNPATWRNQLLVQGKPALDSEGGVQSTTGDAYRAIATRFWTYVLYDNDETEYYDLATDPEELDNVVGQLPDDFADAVEARIEELYACAGEVCRAIENRPANR
jgi:arylsulfatase A-like enzyme